MNKQQQNLATINLIMLLTKYTSLVINFNHIYDSVIALKDYINQMSELENTDSQERIISFQQSILELRQKIDSNQKLINDMNQIFSEESIDYLDSINDEIQAIIVANNMYIMELEEAIGKTTELPEE